jgi:hypothetical protein
VPPLLFADKLFFIQILNSSHDKLSDASNPESPSRDFDSDNVSLHRNVVMESVALASRVHDIGIARVQPQVHHVRQEDLHSAMAS